MTIPLIRRALNAVTRVSALVAVALATTTAGAAAATSTNQVRRATSVSTNWAGYAVTRRFSAQTFTRVAASWTQPAAACRRGQAAYSAFWIGLGGYRAGAQKLEQIGTEADCTRRGAPVGYAWYELVPAAPVNLHLRVRAGDAISADVAVSGNRVSLMMADATTGRSVTRTLAMSSPDVSSAEWIAEAPSQCSALGNCRVLPLADFGAVPFTGASVSSARRSGGISQAAWAVTRVELRDDALSLADGQFGAPVLAAAALPSALLDAGRSFTVSWRSVASSTPLDAPGSAGPPA